MNVSIYKSSISLKTKALRFLFFYYLQFFPVFSMFIISDYQDLDDSRN